MTREIVFTREEIDAMHEKIHDPSKEVICPRCGGELLFREFPTAVEVYCETEDCLRGSIRGI